MYRTQSSQEIAIHLIGGSSDTYSHSMAVLGFALKLNLKLSILCYNLSIIDFGGKIETSIS